MSYISLNKTSFTALGGKITAAMQHILNTGESVRLKNRKGEPWLLITLAKHHDRGYTFQFITEAGVEVGDIVLKASVKYWSDKDHILFWSMHGEAWELTEHPIIRVAREESAKLAEAHKANIAALMGATHSVHFWGGRKAYGAYQRNWYGKKCLYLLNVETGEWNKVTTEALNTVSHCMAFPK